MITNYLLAYLITATRGGVSRGRILLLLKKHPLNMNKVANELKMDYKTAQHHLKVLTENNAVGIVNKGRYGAVYHVSADMEQNWKLFEEMWKRVGKE